jgi:gamma-glutamylaminecyclotransferase
MTAEGPGAVRLFCGGAMRGEREQYLFVYGTLQRGQRNHHLLRDQSFVGKAVTEPLYRLVDCGRYPALVEDAANGRPVRGELFLVDAVTLARLDVLEDAPHLYQLRPVRLRDFPHPAVTYVYQQDVSRFRDGGDGWPRDRGA